MTFYLKKHLGLRVNLVKAMSMASDLSELGLGQTTPNPCVGCVILDGQDTVKGVGYHKKYGEAHAEVEAFKSLSMDDDFRSLTVVVTLEPCSHQGKTPSCAKMLIEKKASRVIYLLKDPNPLVSGLGHKLLIEAGIKVYCIEDLLQRQKIDQPDDILKSIYKNKSILRSIIKKQKYLNRHFLYAMNSELPYVTLKWAQTLDGTIGLENQRLMITNLEVQKEVHHLRACHDVILVGSTTVLKDNPKLNNRFGSSKNKSNKIVVLDPNLEVLTHIDDLELFQLHPKSNLIFITHTHQNTEAFERLGFQFIKVDYQQNSGAISDVNANELNGISKNSKTIKMESDLFPNQSDLNLKDALQLIKEKCKINSVFVEGGAKTISSFLDQNVYNELYVFSALKIILKSKTNRIHYRRWIKFLFIHILNLKIKFYETNFLVQVRK